MKTTNDFYFLTNEEEEKKIELIESIENELCNIMMEKGNLYKEFMKKSDELDKTIQDDDEFDKLYKNLRKDYYSKNDILTEKYNILQDRKIEITSTIPM